MRDDAIQRLRDAAYGLLLPDEHKAWHLICDAIDYMQAGREEGREWRKRFELLLGLISDVRAILRDAKDYAAADLLREHIKNNIPPSWGALRDDR